MVVPMPKPPQGPRKPVEHNYITDIDRVVRPAGNPQTPLPKVDAETLRRERWAAFDAKVAASYPEFICYEWLTKKRKLVPNRDFIFQAPILGGRTQFGGFVLDFYFPARQLAWFVQGLRYHYTNPRDRARDMLAVAIVSGRGIRVVQVFEDDIFEREEFTLRKALEGEEIRRRGQA